MRSRMTQARLKGSEDGTPLNSPSKGTRWQFRSLFRVWCSAPRGVFKKMRVTVGQSL